MSEPRFSDKVERTQKACILHRSRWFIKHTMVFSARTGNHASSVRTIVRKDRVLVPEDLHQIDVKMTITYSEQVYSSRTKTFFQFRRNQSLCYRYGLHG